MQESTQQALVISPGDVSAWNVVGESIRCLMPAEQTKGQYALFDFDSRPGGGPPLHIHERENEIFYFFEGTFEVQIGEEIIRPQPGTLAFIPRGVPHTYRNAGDRPAKAFFMLTPAGELGQFFEAADQLPPQDPPDVEALVALAQKHGLQIVGPPLGAPE